MNATCPKCGEVFSTITTCQMCSFEFTPRKENTKFCPECHSPFWRTGKPEVIAMVSEAGKKTKEIVKE